MINEYFQEHFLQRIRNIMEYIMYNAYFSRRFRVEIIKINYNQAFRKKKINLELPKISNESNILRYIAG